MTQRSRSHDGVDHDAGDLDAVDLDEGGFDLDAPTPSRRRGARARDDGGDDGDDGASEGGDGGGARHGGRVRGVLRRSWPEAAPVWLRGPAAVVAVALVAAAVGGVFATHQQRAALDQALAVERVLGAVEVGDPYVYPLGSDVTGRAAVGADGVVDLRLGIRLTNTSDTAAAVTVTGLELADEPQGPGPRITVVAAETPLQLDALATDAVELDASVDCADVPETASSQAAESPDWVAASVVVAGDEHPVRWGTVSEWRNITAQLSEVCHSSQSPYVDISSVVLLDDGRLQVELDNPGSVAASVEVTTSGTDVTAEPSLPVVVEPGERGTVVLTAAPDCSRADDLVDQTAEVLVLPVGVDEGSSSTVYDPYGSDQLAVWLGRQTALTCS